MFDWLGLITILVVGWGAYVLVCAWLIALRLRRPPRRTYAWAVSKGLPGDPGEMRPARAFESIEVVHRGIAIPVWSLPGDAPEGPTILLTPGWGDSRVGGLVRLPVFLTHASRVILWDPPGLGASEAIGAAKRRAPLWPMGTRDHEALFAVLDALIDGEAGARPVILFGWSAGAGTSVVAGATEPGAQATGADSFFRTWRIAGVIAEAPYRLAWTPARNVIRGAGLPWFLCGPLAFRALGLRLGVGAQWRGFDRAEHAARLRGRIPMLVLHGDQDEVCPIEDGRAIASAGGGEIVEIEGGRHNDLWANPEFAARSAQAIHAFVARLM